jgi:hypothetical protein
MSLKAFILGLGFTSVAAGAAHAAPGALAVNLPGLGAIVAETVFATEETTLSADELASLSGEGGIPLSVWTNQTLTAVNSGNSISAGAVNSGAISLNQNAFAGFDGIGNFVINSGHNNNLQSSMSVSIIITQ